jgi:hypothetical protein
LSSDGLACIYKVKPIGEEVLLSNGGYTLLALADKLKV